MGTPNGHPVGQIIITVQGVRVRPPLYRNSGLESSPSIAIWFLHISSRCGVPHGVREVLIKSYNPLNHADKFKRSEDAEVAQVARLSNTHAVGQ